MHGGGKRPRRARLRDLVYAWLGAFLALSFVALLDQWSVGEGGFPLLLGSFGASAVLLFGATKSPLAQPRNFVGGHVLSAAVGVTMAKFWPGPLWLGVGLTAATAIVLMMLTKTLHPPGGATALIAVLGGEKIKALGYWYVLSPCLLGALVILGVALLFNNLPRKRRYPLFW